MEHQGKSKKQLEFSYKAALVGFVGVLITFILHLIFNQKYSPVMELVDMKDLKSFEQ